MADRYFLDMGWEAVQRLRARFLGTHREPDDNDWAEAIGDAIERYYAKLPNVWDEEYESS